MKIVKTTALVIFVLALPVLFLTAGISAAANCPWLYEYGFHKYDISRVTGIDDAELNKAAREIIRYWNSGENEIDITVIKNGQPFTLFNEREVAHMVDVKALFRLAYTFLLGSFLYVLLFLGLSLFLWKDKRLTANGLFWGGGLSIALIAVIGVMAVTDFNWFFTRFHLLSFSNDLWLLDPTTDYLIMLFPEGFWFDAAMVCVIFTVLLSLVSGFTGLWLKKKASA